MVAPMFHVKHQRGDNDRATTRQRARGIALLTALLLAACSAPESAEDIAPPAATPAAGVTAAASTPAPASAAVEFTDNAEQGEAKREFAYSWPAQVSAVPALVERFTAERDTLLAEQKSEWAEALREFGDSDCIACVNRGAEKSWEVVADLPGYLSLSASIYSYTGGAHGNSGTTALIWDRGAQVAREPEDFFTSPASMQDVLGPQWCKGLSAARRRKMGGEGPVDETTFPCPPIADLTILLGSAGKTAFDRIGLIADPYVAGSYAEGQYEVTIPVTPAVLKLVKPEFKSAFALGK